MNAFFHRCASQHLMAVALSALLLVAPTSMAAPGAHGPNGEHLDGPTSMRAASALPRVEAQSEAFELVATLYGSALSVLIDRFETNEPVLNAQLEVETGGVKAKATFHADQGDYAIDDPKLLALLRTPGEHGLVFTLVAGKDSDLLDGTLVTAGGGAAALAAKNDHGHAHSTDDHGHGHGDELERAAWIGAGVAALGLIGGIAWWRQRRRAAGKLQGAV
ncbi:MAG: hypothetical protein H7Z19_22770 [Chitinophagaceae bacterium]|nr:hypothetical protein [Rubrivivax sp.]